MKVWMTEERERGEPWQWRGTGRRGEEKETSETSFVAFFCFELVSNYVQVLSWRDLTPHCNLASFVVVFHCSLLA